MSTEILKNIPESILENGVWFISDPDRNQLVRYLDPTKENFEFIEAFPISSNEELWTVRWGAAKLRGTMENLRGVINEYLSYHHYKSFEEVFEKYGEDAYLRIAQCCFESDMDYDYKCLGSFNQCLAFYEATLKENKYNRVDGKNRMMYIAPLPEYEIFRYGEISDIVNEFHFMNSIDGVTIEFTFEDFSIFRGPFMGKEMKNFLSNFAIKYPEPRYLIKMKFFFANTEYMVTDVEDWPSDDIILSFEHSLAGIPGFNGIK